MSSSTAPNPSEKPPQPAYVPTPGSILNVDLPFYTRLSSAPRTSTLSYTIPPRSGYAWHVPAGSIFRLSTPEGPQVGDLNLWNADNPRERFWAKRTMQLERAHVSVGNRLWSCLPFMRPMVTIVGDSLRAFKPRWGGGVHDLLGTRCDPYVNKMLTGDDFDFHCHSNLVRAVLPYGLTEFDVHDVINVFQVTGLNEDERYFMEASPATKDSYLEFFAEQPLLCALSTCPGGDLSTWGWAEGGEGGGNMVDVCRPIKVEVFEIQNRDEVLKGWEEPKKVDYRGNHGIKIPLGQDLRRDA